MEQGGHQREADGSLHARGEARSATESVHGELDGMRDGGKKQKGDEVAFPAGSDEAKALGKAAIEACGDGAQGGLGGHGSSGCVPAGLPGGGEEDESAEEGTEEGGFPVPSTKQRIAQ